MFLSLRLFRCLFICLLLTFAHLCFVHFFLSLRFLGGFSNVDSFGSVGLGLGSSVKRKSLIYGRGFANYTDTMVN